MSPSKSENDSDEIWLQNLRLQFASIKPAQFSEHFEKSFDDGICELYRKQIGSPWSTITSIWCDIQKSYIILNLSNRLSLYLNMLTVQSRVNDTFKFCICSLILDIVDVISCSFSWQEMTIDRIREPGLSNKRCSFGIICTDIVGSRVHLFYHFREINR